MRLAPAAVSVLLLAGCSLDEEQPSAGTAQLASGKLVPTRCEPKPPGASATVAFVANGNAWALDPRSGRLSCLFSVRRPGPFAWGPRGDRALLARLEVKSVGGGPSRAAARAAPVAASWGRPIGKSIVFVGRGGRSLLKAHPAGGGFTDVTPLRFARYERVVYHPSGLAFAFVFRDERREAVWISSNRGKDPRPLVHGRLHTGFDALAFTQDGRVLYVAAQHGATHVDIHTVAVAGGTEAPLVWRGGPHERVTELYPGHGPEFAFTVGRSCATRRAVVVIPGVHAEGVDLLPDAATSRALGWLDDVHVLAAAGGCGNRLDLYSVSVRTLLGRLLVRGVRAAAVRRAEPFPPPPLPEAAPGNGFA